MLFIVIVYDINVSYSTDLHLFVYHICPPLIVTLNFIDLYAILFILILFLPKIFHTKRHYLLYVSSVFFYLSIITDKLH